MAYIDLFGLLGCNGPPPGSILFAKDGVPKRDCSMVKRHRKKLCPIAETLWAIAIADTPRQVFDHPVGRPSWQRLGGAAKFRMSGYVVEDDYSGVRNGRAVAVT